MRTSRVEAPVACDTSASGALVTKQSGLTASSCALSSGEGGEARDEGDLQPFAEAVEHGVEVLDREREAGEPVDHAGARAEGAIHTTTPDQRGAVSAPKIGTRPRRALDAHRREE